MITHHVRLKRHGDVHAFTANADRKCVKLSAEKAQEIRELRQAGFTLRVISADYGVCESTISKTALGLHWPEEGQKKRGAHDRR